METPNKILQIRRFLFAIAIFSLGMSLSSRATNYYVSPTGDDVSNNGSKDPLLKPSRKQQM